LEKAKQRRLLLGGVQASASASPALALNLNFKDKKYDVLDKGIIESRNSMDL